MTTVHTSVLLEETIRALDLHNGDVVLDATLGGGGHAEAILQRAETTVIGLDADPAAIARVTKRLMPYGERVMLVQSNFRAVGSVLEKLGQEHIHKALFDLGLSSDELEQSGRGFSFLRDEPLLMTFEPDAGLTAKDLLLHLSAPQLTDIFRTYGEERYAKRIAEAIVSEREETPIETTFQLSDLIKRAVPSVYAKGRSHPATKVFQALRIAVNDELDALREGLRSAWAALVPGGRLAVISFHSGEDRIVKHFMREKQSAGEGTLVHKKPVPPGRAEIAANPRARSAKLRAIEKEIA